MAAGFKSLTSCQSLQFIGKISAIHRQLIGNASGRRERRFSDYSEDAMIEQPTIIPPFSVLGWKTLKLLP